MSVWTHIIGVFKFSGVNKEMFDNFGLEKTKDRYKLYIDEYPSLKEILSLLSKNRYDSSISTTDFNIKYAEPLIFYSECPFSDLMCTEYDEHVYHYNGLPCGSEGPLKLIYHYDIENDADIITFYGDLRDYTKDNKNIIIEWWNQVHELLHIQHSYLHASFDDSEKPLILSNEQNRANIDVNSDNITINRGQSYVITKNGIYDAKCFEETLSKMKFKNASDPKFWPKCDGLVSIDASSTTRTKNASDRFINCKWITKI